MCKRKGAACVSVALMMVLYRCVRVLDVICVVARKESDGFADGYCTCNDLADVWREMESVC